MVTDAIAVWAYIRFESGRAIDFHGEGGLPDSKAVHTERGPLRSGVEVRTMNAGG